MNFDCITTNLLSKISHHLIFHSGIFLLSALLYFFSFYSDSISFLSISSLSILSLSILFFLLSALLYFFDCITTNLLNMQLQLHFFQTVTKFYSTLGLIAKYVSGNEGDIKRLKRLVTYSHAFPKSFVILVI